MLAENPGALQADGGAAGIVIGAGRVSLGVVGVAIAGIVVPGHQINAPSVCRIGALQDSVNIGNGCGLRNARGRRVE